MGIGSVVKEVAKAVVVSAGVEAVRDKVVPPLAEKLKRGFKRAKKNIEKTKFAKMAEESYSKEYDAKRE